VDRVPDTLCRRRHVDLPNTQRAQGIQHGVAASAPWTCPLTISGLINRPKSSTAA
jgi:hypothetical protein